MKLSKLFTTTVLALMLALAGCSPGTADPPQPSTTDVPVTDSGVTPSDDTVGPSNVDSTPMAGHPLCNHLANHQFDLGGSGATGDITLAEVRPMRDEALEMVPDELKPDVETYYDVVIKELERATAEGEDYTPKPVTLDEEFMTAYQHLLQFMFENCE